MSIANLSDLMDQVPAIRERVDGAVKQCPDGTKAHSYRVDQAVHDINALLALVALQDQYIDTYWKMLLERGRKIKEIEDRRERAGG